MKKNLVSMYKFGYLTIIFALVAIIVFAIYLCNKYDSSNDVVKVLGAISPIFIGAMSTISKLKG